MCLRGLVGGYLKLDSGGQALVSMWSALLGIVTARRVCTLLVFGTRFRKGGMRVLCTSSRTGRFRFHGFQEQPVQIVKKKYNFVLTICEHQSGVDTGDGQQTRV